MYKYVLSLLGAFFCLLPFYGQYAVRPKKDSPETVPSMRISIDEVRTTYRAFIGRQKIAPLPTTERFGNSLYLLSSPSLAHPFFVEQGAVPRWWAIWMGKRQELFVCGLVDIHTGEDKPSVWERAKAHFGYSKVWDEDERDSLEVLNLKCPDGEYAATARLFPYQGFMASKRLLKVRVKDNSYESIWWSYFACGYYERASTYDIIHRPMHREEFSDWDNPKLLQFGYDLLAHELTMLIAQEDYNIQEFDQVVFAEVQEDGRILLHDLTDFESADEYFAFRVLRAHMRRIQPYALGHIYTSDGRILPGHFLHIRKLSWRPDQWVISIPKEPQFRREDGL